MTVDLYHQHVAIDEFRIRWKVNSHGPPTIGYAHALSHRLREEFLSQHLDPQAAKHVSTQNLPSMRATYIFHQHCALITTPFAVSQGRNQSPRVHLQQGLWFLVRVDFDILIGNAFQLQRDPYTLHKWTAKPFLPVSKAQYTLETNNIPKATSE